MRYRDFQDPGDMEVRLVEMLGSALEGRLGAAAYGVLITGGGTMLPVYERLAHGGVRASPDVSVMLSDERVVPAGSRDHNYAKIEPALDVMGVPATRRIYVSTDLPLETSVKQFDNALGQVVRGESIPFGVLGLGGDGHIAGLFSDDDIRRGSGVRAVAVERPDGHKGISVTAEFLQSVRRLVLFVRGEAKRDAVETMRTRPRDVVAGRILEHHESLELWYCPE